MVRLLRKKLSLFQLALALLMLRLGMELLLIQRAVGMERARSVESKLLMAKLSLQS